MGDSSNVSCSSPTFDGRIINSKSSPRVINFFSLRGLFTENFEIFTSMKESIQGNGMVGDAVIFFATTAALEIVRRFSKAKCPFIWRGLQALQILYYPPFKWLQRWIPFKGLARKVEKLSRPMLVLSIATVFSDQSTFTDEPSTHIEDQTSSGSESEPSSELDSLEIRRQDKVPNTCSSEKWLLQLQMELKRQGIIVPERLDENELRRFYAAANGDFSKFLSSVMKTIHWRQSYCILSPEELESWSHLVFWHGCDLELRPCLIVRLGLACSYIKSHDRPNFVKAVVSQIEQGILNLVDEEHPQITVLMDCLGLSPFGFPIKTMRSCAVLLQDHYPNRLGCLIIVRLPQIARVITQTLFQVLRPATRQKLTIIGENYQEVLSEYFQNLSSFLGGNCSCSKCSDIGTAQETKEEIRELGSRFELKNTDVVSLSEGYHHTGIMINGSCERSMKRVIIGIFMLWIIILIILGTRHPELLPPWF